MLVGFNLVLNQDIRQRAYSNNRVIYRLYDNTYLKFVLVGD